MAGRGRGRGGGRGWGRGTGMFPRAAEVPFELFPEFNLPDNNTDKIDLNMKRLLSWSSKFQNYWKASPYFLEETTFKGNESQKMHIERFSDKKRTVFTRDSLTQVLVFKDFPKELVQGTSRRISSRKKYRWNPESEIKRLDLYEQLEKKGQGREYKGEKDSKDGENEDGNEDGNEDEDANEEDEEDPDEFGDDDYNQNEYFDDDEDDYNDADDGVADEADY